MCVYTQMDVAFHVCIDTCVGMRALAHVCVFVCVRVWVGVSMEVRGYYFALLPRDNIF